MFWGLVLEPGKRYAQTVDKPFHVSMASLDVPQSENELVSVNVNFQNTDFILCNLQKHKVFQTPLDLNFMAGDKIAFYTIGKGRVHLTGYLMDEEEDDDLEIEPDEDDSEEEEKVANDVSKQKTPVQVNKQEKRKSAGHTPGKPVAKKSKIDIEEDEDDDEDEGDSDIDGLEDSDDVEMESGDEEEDDGEEEDDDDDEDEDEDESEGEDMTPQKQLPPGKNKEKQQSSQKQAQQQQQNKQVNTPQQNKQVNTPNEMKKKKEKTPGGATPNIQANGTPEMQSGKKNKKKGGETPGDGKGNQTPKAAPGVSPQKKVLEGGVAVEDTVIGSGQVAKPGRMVTVYYTGRLKQNNKKFDETSQGPGFKFRLGKGEVIKGWDIGLTGMKVGGKRKLTIPSHLAYGAKGSPPVIPPNSVLVFDVELRNVN